MKIVTNFRKKNIFLKKRPFFRKHFTKLYFDDFKAEISYTFKRINFNMTIWSAGISMNFFVKNVFLGHLKSKLIRTQLSHFNKFPFQCVNNYCCFLLRTYTYVFYLTFISKK